jgi:glycerol-3-phosphate dehydrogenase
LVVTEDGRKRDFIVAVDREAPPFVNLIGIESPGLSAAMALARHVVNLPCIKARWALHSAEA